MMTEFLCVVNCDSKIVENCESDFFPRGSGTLLGAGMRKQLFLQCQEAGAPKRT